MDIQGERKRKCSWAGGWVTQAGGMGGTEAPWCHSSFEFPAVCAGGVMAS